VIAAPAGREEELAALAPEGLEVAVVTGGASRSESVAAALEAAGETPLVVVHDAARPLVTAALIDAVVARLTAEPGAAGAIAAAPVADTVKRAGAARTAGAPLDGEALTVAATEDRAELWAAQTPQAFRSEALRSALRASEAELSAATDDAMLVEAAGGKVLIEPVAGPNLKVTGEADLRLAALLLGER
jgi:2-C-methyl-D-erythritol 4-phosphate cytidylyltransferase